MTGFCAHGVRLDHECTACITTPAPAADLAFADRIAQAIGDPGSIVGRKLGPSWGVGHDGYSEREETVTRWSTRAVLALLAEGDVA